MSFAQKMVSSTVTKRVDCSKCGRCYEYELKRTVVGKSSKEAATQEQADAQAAQDADAKLKAALDADCDMVSCLSCGAITEEMKAHRRKFFGGAFACLGVGGGGILLIYLLSIFLKKIFIVPAAISVVCFLLGIALLVAGIIMVLFPRKGKL